MLATTVVEHAFIRIWKTEKREIGFVVRPMHSYWQQPLNTQYRQTSAWHVTTQAVWHPRLACLLLVLCCHPWESIFLLLLFPCLQFAPSVTGPPRNTGQLIRIAGYNWGRVASVEPEAGLHTPPTRRYPASWCSRTALPPSSPAHLHLGWASVHGSILLSRTYLWLQTHASYKRCFSRKLPTRKQRWNKKNTNLKINWSLKPIPCSLLSV